ncbi:MAG: GNAT family N-acetyltransferase [Gammaproteobacteria bacterium]
MLSRALTVTGAEDLRLRLANTADAADLLRWRNDDDTRKFSLHREVVTWSAHLDWLSRVLRDDNTELYVAETAGLPAGTVRIDHRNGVKELSWTVAPECRGRGLGSLIVGMAVQRTAPPLFARIHPLNDASRRIAAKTGFVEVGDEDGWSLWCREL